MRTTPIALAALLLLAACPKAAQTAGPAKLRAADYHPLAVGNQWTYQGHDGKSERTLTISGIKDGFYVFAEDPNGRLKVDAEGLRDDKRYMLHEPLERGKTWSSIVSVGSTEHYEIADTGFTVSTPAGAFNDCVLVRSTNRDAQGRVFKIEWTYAPNVGLVRLVTSVQVGDREIPQLSEELKSFKLAKPGP